MNYLLDKPIEGKIGKVHYQVRIEWRNGVLIGDEPEKIGGKDTGPDPYTLLLSSLAACTLSTLRMYIDRKGWDIPQIEVRLNMYHDTDNPAHTIFDRVINFDVDLNEEIKSRLLLVAQKCPVSKILENQISIKTTF